MCVEEQVATHKVVLAACACSPLPRSVLLNYLSGVSVTELLQRILSFM